MTNLLHYNNKFNKYSEGASDPFAEAKRLREAARQISVDAEKASKVYIANKPYPDDIVFSWPKNETLHNNMVYLQGLLAYYGVNCLVSKKTANVHRGGSSENRSNYLLELMQIIKDRVGSYIHSATRIHAFHNKQIRNLDVNIGLFNYNKENGVIIGITTIEIVKKKITKNGDIYFARMSYDIDVSGKIVSKKIDGTDNKKVFVEENLNTVEKEILILLERFNINAEVISAHINTHSINNMLLNSKNNKYSGREKFLNTLIKLQGGTKNEAR